MGEYIHVGNEKYVREDKIVSVDVLRARAPQHGSNTYVPGHAERVTLKLVNGDSVVIHATDNEVFRSVLEQLGIPYEVEELSPTQHPE